MAQKTQSQDSKVLGLAGIMLAFLALSMNLLPMTGGPATAVTTGNTDNESRPTPCQAGYFVTSVNETNSPINGTIMISCSQVGWTQLTGYPSGCSANQFVTAVGAVLTCSTVSYMGLTNFPTGCSAGQFVTAVGVTLTCSSVAWTQLTSFPSGCGSNQAVIVIGSTLTCAPFCVVGGTNCPLMDSLAASYPMEEGSGTITADVSGNGRTQTFTNTPTWQSQCRIGSYCLAFGGEAGSSTNAYTSSTFSLTTNTFTISQWVFPTSIASGLKCYSYAPGTHFVLNCSGPGFCADIDGTCYGGACPSFVSGKWVMVTIVDNAGTFSFSENGIACGVNASVAGNFFTTHFSIGGGDGTLTFIGYIDQVEVWSHALSSSEISYLYNTQLSESVANSPSTTRKLTGQTGTVAALVNMTSFSANSIYTVGADLDVTAFTSGTITVQVTYTDWNSGAQTITIDTATVLGDVPGNSESILVKASTNIIIKTTGTFVATYNVGTWVFFIG